jgi:hypothetical protein
MTVFKAIKSICSMRINDVSGNRLRVKYRWVCAKKKCSCLCAESNCEIVKRIGALKNAESLPTVRPKRAAQQRKEAILRFCGNCQRNDDRSSEKVNYHR